MPLYGGDEGKIGVEKTTVYCVIILGLMLSLMPPNNRQAYQPHFAAEETKTHSKGQRLG